MPSKSLQQQYASKSICYGCGPANTEGLHIESFVKDDLVIAHFLPKPHHHAFPGILNGGIIGTLLDCHCNWAACWYLQQDQALDYPPCTVTAEYTIKMQQPTPMTTPLYLEASLDRIDQRKAYVNASLYADGINCATCQGLFISVKEGHPAFHRW